MFGDSTSPFKIPRKREAVSTGIASPSNESDTIIDVLMFASSSNVFFFQKEGYAFSEIGATVCYLVSFVQRRQ